jgi:hypothetical protein
MSPPRSPGRLTNRFGGGRERRHVLLVGRLDRFTRRGRTARGEHTGPRRTFHARPLVFGKCRAHHRSRQFPTREVHDHLPEFTRGITGQLGWPGKRDHSGVLAGQGLDADDQHPSVRPEHGSRCRRPVRWQGPGVGGQDDWSRLMACRGVHGFDGWRASGRWRAAPDHLDSSFPAGWHATVAGPRSNRPRGRLGGRDGRHRACGVARDARHGRGSRRGRRLRDDRRARLARGALGGSQGFSCRGVAGDRGPRSRRQQKEHQEPGASCNYRKCADPCPHSRPCCRRRSHVPSVMSPPRRETIPL